MILTRQMNLWAYSVSLPLIKSIVPIEDSSQTSMINL